MARRTSRQRMLSGPSHRVLICASLRMRATGHVSTYPLPPWTSMASVAVVAGTTTVGGFEALGIAREEERLGVDEFDLARGDRLGAELVLQLPNADAVAGAIASTFKDEEGGDAADAVGRADGLGHDDERLAVEV